jgi:uncharacterized membrane protein YozB (DUF420 family)
LRAALVLLSVLTMLLFISSVYASVTVPVTAFFFIDGEWKHFAAEHTFTTVQRIADIWYFDGQTFDQVEGGVAPSLITPQIAGVFAMIVSNFNVGIAIGSLSILILVGVFVIKGDLKNATYVGIFATTILICFYLVMFIVAVVSNALLGA